MKVCYAALVLAITALFLIQAPAARAETWNLTTGDGSWVDSANWTPATVPNSVGASAIFNTPTGTSTSSLNGDVTVGSITFDHTSAATFTFSIRDNTTASDPVRKLTFDAAGAGPATITASGTAATSSRIQATMYFEDNVVADVSNTVGNSTAGALSITGDITGPGGLTKTGDGQLTMAFNAGSNTQVKAYTGPTVVNGGRWRTSVGGAPTLTSSFTVNNGGQLTPLAAGTYTFGPGPLNLNGAGPTTGPFAPFPGAVRQATDLAVTITNPVVLQSDALLHVQGVASGSLTLNGGVSGSGRLSVGSIPHDANIGRVILDGTNSYAGGTKVQAGTLEALGSSTTALGTGNVTVDSANLVFGGSSAKLHIQSGATNAIADTATLSLAGGNVVGVADDGYAELDGGINETIAGLVLGGVTKAPGIYGSSSSGAPLANQFDEFFSGSGTVTVLAPAVLAGDYNNNGVVDAADYVLWRNGGPLQNDPIGPPIGPAQYDQWKANFGKPVSGVGSSNALGQVPEPTTIALVGLLITGLLVGRREK